MSTLVTKVMSKEPAFDNVTFSKMKFLIYGPAGVGKSTFFSKFNNHLFLNTDPGLALIKTRHIPIVSWKDFKKIVEELVSYQNPQSDKYDSKYDDIIIVLDLIDGLRDLCRKSVLARMGWAHESEGDYGKGHDMVLHEFKTVISNLCAYYGVGFISHSKDIQIRGRIDRLSKVVPSISGKVGNFIEGLCDFIGYCDVSTTKSEKELGERYITFLPVEDLTAKNRGGVFPEKLPLDFFVVRDTFNTNVKKLQQDKLSTTTVIRPKTKLRIGLK